MRSSKMLRKPSTSSSEVMKSSISGGNRNCSSEKSCPSSRRYDDHFGGRRSPSRSHVTISGQASRNPANSPLSWTSGSRSQAHQSTHRRRKWSQPHLCQHFEKDGFGLNGHARPKQGSLLRYYPRQCSASTWHGGSSSHLWHEGELPHRVHQIRSCQLQIFLSGHTGQTGTGQIHGSAALCLFTSQDARMKWGTHSPR
jgi:hypothetical protein